MTSPPLRTYVEPPLRRLKMFDAIIRCGSISRAASEVRLAQPSVTFGLAKLEAIVGETLVTRGRGGIQATPAGLILHRRVDRMLRKIERAAEKLFTVEDAYKAAAFVRNITGAQVRSHLAVDATGSFRAAAAKLRVAAPTLNRSVRQLKDMVGVPLYRRTPAGFTTAAAGVEFASDLRVALREFDQALDELATARGAAYGRIAFACLPLVPKHFLSDAVAGLIRQYPGVEISLQEDAFEPLMRALLGGDVDIVLGALRNQHGGKTHEVPLFSDPYVLVVREGHPLLSVANLQDVQLAEHSWLIPWRGTPRRDLLEAFFSRLPNRPHVVIETSSLAMTKANLNNSDCISLLSQCQVEVEDLENQLRILQVQVEDQPRMVGYTTRRDWLPTPVQSAFIDRLVAGSYRLTAMMKYTS